ncbi:glycosyltransferase family 2 protein [Halomonas sp. TRM85114]|uniref:glycosyltransferase family 2 protein n=1 Tax=Halomonas jincaotanensis TaxID=2810616 RepID=UPI001BD56658|nr:glycosyltransferase family A protein [Halomonas jincaotanensis]MBS9402926.1 glycosyltransferase family 2 protein [Halomonas jincaotanensis]
MHDLQPSVAIIIPCFNRWPYVVEAIDSVLEQTWPNTRCIIVDDASTDDSYPRLRERYSGVPRVAIHQLENNQGQSAARNRGVELSDADYIGFLDSDDLLVVTAVENRMRLALEHPAFEGIIFSDKIAETTGASLLPGKKVVGAELPLSEFIENGNWLHTNSFLIKRSTFNKLKGFNEHLRKKEDIEFFLRALVDQPARYAGGSCCMVRSMDSQRARHDHPRIIEQGERFIAAIQANAALTEVLTHAQLTRLVEDDTKSILQSLYRLKRGQQFRHTLRDAIRQRKVQLNPRLAKRYLLSFFN